MKNQSEREVTEDINRMDECSRLGNDFAEMTKYLSREAKWYALDAMACTFHNQGYAMEGNTEANDAYWLAHGLAQRLDHGRPFNAAPPERQEELKLMAYAAIQELPALCERISHRYINMSKAMRLMSDVAYRQAKQMRDKIH